MRHLKPRFLLRNGSSVTIVTDPHGKPARSAFLSIAKILVWLVEEWCGLLWERKDVVLICDRYYHDLLIDPKRYRYGGPVWIAKCIGNLIPQPSLWVLLDAPAEVLRSRKQEVTLEETRRQRDAYLSFIKSRRNSVIVNGAQPLDVVTSDVERAIKEAVARTS